MFRQLPKFLDYLSKHLLCSIAEELPVVDSARSDECRIEPLHVVGRHEQNPLLCRGHPIDGIQQARKCHSERAERGLEMRKRTSLVSP